MAKYVKHNYDRGKIRIIESVCLAEKAEKEEERIAQEFLSKLFKGVAEGCRKYFRPEQGLFEMPYYFSERRMDSVVLPVLSRLCDGLVIAEYPVSRNDDAEGEVSAGRIDYWCVYRDYTFAIEMKHSEKHLIGGVLRKRSVKGRWAKMCQQLKTVRKDLKCFSEMTKGVIPIGLHFIASREYNPKVSWNVPYGNAIKDTEKTLDSFRENIATKSHRPDYAAAWIVPKGIALSSADGEVYDPPFICPRVVLLVKVNRKITHKGAKKRAELHGK